MTAWKLAPMLALVCVGFLCSQQQPAAPAPGPGAGRGGRGGFGFTQPEPIDFADNTGWTSMFDGSTLKGWDGNMDLWRVENGAIVSGGMEVSHLFSDRGDYENFHYKVEAKISDKGNSGQYFRAKFAPGYPPGYEAQINSNSFDVVKTGSLYPAFAKKKLSNEERAKIIVTKELVPPDTWFTQEVIANDNHIIIKVNGQKTVDFVDEGRAYTRGHFALQQHTGFKGKGPGGTDIETILHVRKVEVKELPPTAK